MNIIYEITKQRGITILIRGSMEDSMNPAAAIAVSLSAREALTAPVADEPAR